MVLSVVAAVVSEGLELLEFSSFSPQEMIVILRHEIRKMFINIFISEFCPTVSVHLTSIEREG